MEKLELLAPKFIEQISVSKKIKASEVMNKYITFLKDSFRIDYYNSLSNIQNANVILEDVAEFIIKEKSAQRKNNSLYWLKRFWSFASDKMGIENPILSLPDTVPQTELERQLTILHLIQESGKTPEELSRVLLYEKATILRDVYNIRDGKGLGILIGQFGLSNGQVKYECSIHPFLLAYSLTHVGELLLGLHQAIESNAPHKPAFIYLYRDLWRQLTPYGQERMLRLGLPVPSDIDSAATFLTEETILRNSLHSRLIDSLKQQAPLELILRFGDENKRDLAIVVNLGPSHDKRVIKCRSVLTGQEYKIGLDDVIDAKIDRQ